MEVVRTPDHRFARLSAYPYPSRSLALDEDGELRLAYVAEGANENRPVLLLHGPPTWSYLWRRVIPMLVEGGCRVVAPDLVGFGRSDKLVRARDHRVERHAAWLTALVEVLDLRQAIVVAHGAAALLAFRLAATGSSPGGSAAGDEASARFARLVCVSPLFAPAGTPAEDVSASEPVARGCADALSDATRTGYDAPFPDAEHRVGLGIQQVFVSGGPEELPPVRVPLVAVAGERDELAPLDWTSRLPGSPECRRIQIGAAGHYVPEDRGPELALALLALLGEKP